MYNSFLYESKQKNRKSIQKQENMNSILIKNQKKKNEKLIQRYEKRIQNFIYKMEEQPIVHFYQSDNKKFLKPFRQQNPQKNISNKIFRFKQSQDWKSIYTSVQRIQRDSNHNKLQNLNNLKKVQLMNRNLISQSEYILQKEQEKYRRREKTLEIHTKPMKFGLRQKPIKTKQKDLQFKQLNYDQSIAVEQMKRGITNSTVSDDSGSVGSKLENKLISNQKNINIEKFPKIKKSRVVVTESNEVLQNQIKFVKNTEKHYFKSALDLVLKKKKLSKNAKEILLKCKLITNKNEIAQQQDLFQIQNNKKEINK